MLLILTIDVFVSGLLIAFAFTRGFERTLPLATFLLMLFPVESQIALPGLFDLTTQRVIVITLLGLYFAAGPSDPRGAPRQHLPLAFLLALQLLWLCVATAHSVVVTISLKTVLSQILDYFCVFCIFAKGIRSQETIHKILWGFVTAIILLSVFGTIEAYSGWSLLSLFPETSHRFSVEGYDALDRTGRVQATFGHAILFGGALAMAIPAALYLSSVASRRPHRIFLWGGQLFMFLSIYKTASRGPWIGLALSLVALAALGGTRLRKYVLVLALLAATVLIARPGVWSTLRNMYVSTRDPDSPMGESYQWRYALYNLASKELHRSPQRLLWGYGPESFYYLGLTMEFRTDGEMRTVKVESCDSSVAALMMETGYGGLLVTSLLLLAPVFISLRHWWKSGQSSRRLPLLFLCNLCTFCFLMTNVAIYGWGQQSYMLWIVMAMATDCPLLTEARIVSDSRARLQLQDAMKDSSASAWSAL